ncbi:MAG: ion channel [Pseudomonadota bacterium]
MGGQLLLGTTLIVVNVIFHVSWLVWLAQALIRVGKASFFDGRRRWLILQLGLGVFGVIAVHTVAAWSWAAVYLVVGEFSTLSRALYFSVVTSTTLGYGDITLSERWQLLGSFEAMGGLVLFGASTAFLLSVMKHWFTHLADKD